MKNRIYGMWLHELLHGGHGEYKGYDGIHFLADEYVGGDGCGFSPLGVLCDIYLKEMGQSWQLEVATPYYEINADIVVGMIDGYIANPPPSVVEWSGLDSLQIEAIKDLSTQENISHSDIANWIENNIKVRYENDELVDAIFEQFGEGLTQVDLDSLPDNIISFIYRLIDAIMVDWQ